MRFSILLPTRNGGDFLQNCIRSILEQDHDDFELVISDNANTDATPEIIRQFKDDLRVVVGGGGGGGLLAGGGGASGFTYFCV